MWHMNGARILAYKSWLLDNHCLTHFINQNIKKKMLSMRRPQFSHLHINLASLKSEHGKKKLLGMREREK